MRTLFNFIIIAQLQNALERALFTSKMLTKKQETYLIRCFSTGNTFFAVCFLTNILFKFLIKHFRILYLFI